MQTEQAEDLDAAPHSGPLSDCFLQIFSQETGMISNGLEGYFWFFSPTSKTYFSYAAFTVPTAASMISVAHVDECGTATLKILVPPLCGFSQSSSCLLMMGLKVFCPWQMICKSFAATC